MAIGFSLSTFKQDCNLLFVQDAYNTTVRLEQSYEPYIFGVWLGMLVESSLFVIFAFYFAFKSWKIKENRFFLLISALLIMQAVSIEEGSRLNYETTKQNAA